MCLLATRGCSFLNCLIMSFAYSFSWTTACLSIGVLVKTALLKFNWPQTTLLRYYELPLPRMIYFYFRYSVLYFPKLYHPFQSFSQIHVRTANYLIFQFEATDNLKNLPQMLIGLGYTQLGPTNLTLSSGPNYTNSTFGSCPTRPMSSLSLTLRNSVYPHEFPDE